MSLIYIRDVESQQAMPLVETLAVSLARFSTALKQIN